MKNRAPVCIFPYQTGRYSAEAGWCYLIKEQEATSHYLLPMSSFYTWQLFPQPAQFCTSWELEAAPLSEAWTPTATPALLHTVQYLLTRCLWHPRLLFTSIQGWATLFYQHLLATRWLSACWLNSICKYNSILQVLIKSETIAKSQYVIISILYIYKLKKTMNITKILSLRKSYWID